MKIFLTGGTGFVGSAVLKQLVKHGHEVVALVRSENSATIVTAAGATPLQGDINDSAWLAAQLANYDAAIHAATPRNDSNSPQAMDRSVGEAVVQAFLGTDKRYILTGGVWVYGKSEKLTEDLPMSPAEIVAWRPGTEQTVMGKQGLNTMVVDPGVVYGHGQGLAALIANAQQVNGGGLALIGDGHQHWTTVHADDLGALYVAVLERGEPQNRYLGVSGQNPTVRELTQAASRARGIEAEPVAEDIAETKKRLYPPLVDALLLDQQASGHKARALGWQPTMPSLIAELEGGYKAA